MVLTNKASNALSAVVARSAEVQEGGISVVAGNPCTHVVHMVSVSRLIFLHTLVDATIIQVRTDGRTRALLLQKYLMVAATCTMMVGVALRAHDSSTAR